MLDAFILMARNVLVFVALAVPGFLFVKCKLLKVEHSAGLSTLLMYVGMPFLIASSTMKVDLTLDKLLGIAIIFLFGISVVIGTFFLTKPLSCKEKDDKKRGVMQNAIIFCNNGFLGIPLAAAVFGENSEVMMYLIICNIITNIFMYSLGVYLISGDKRTISVKKIVLSPVLIAFVAGILLNLLNKQFPITTYVPEINTYTKYFGDIVTPISMTILGMKLGSVSLKTLFSSKKMYYVSAWKLLGTPILIVGVAFLLRLAFSDVITEAMIFGVFIGFSMPTAGLVTTFADLYDGDVSNAVIYTLGSTLLSIVTIPVLYWVLCLIV